MSSSCSYSSTDSSSSLFSIQVKLTKIWKKIQNSHPLLAGLSDVQDVANATMKILSHNKLECEYILEKLGIAIDLHLIQIEKAFYVQLSAKNASVWAKIPQSQTNNETTGAPSAPIETEEIELVEQSNEDSDDPVDLDKDIFRLIKWPTTVYSIVKMALENFTSKPRYSKESCILHSPSSVINSTLSITPGEILCIKIYRPRVWGAVLTSFYHFGVYVGKITTKDGTVLEHGVIELTKTNDDRSVRINAVPLEGTVKGTCFALTKTKSGRPPLIFKVVYGDRTQKDRDETAKRALDFYENSEHYLKKYSLFSNNCEHFVNVCAFGKPYCDQHFRVILTALPGFLKGAGPVVSQFLRVILVVVAEVVALKSVASAAMSWIGEALALAMLLIEYTFRIIWDIYLLKKSGRLTSRNVWQLLKRHTLSMAPEAIVGVAFLLVAILCTFSGPWGPLIGAVLGISGAIIIALLRFVARPRIERWIEQREAIRLEDFLQWHPNEVARLAMDTLEEDDDHQEIIDQFESKKLTGKAISELVNQERDNPYENRLANTLDFLDPDRLKRFKQNLKGILGHFDISEQLKSAISLTYNARTINIEIPDMSTITVRQLLDVARLNWQIDFAKGQWQVRQVDPDDDERPSIIASSITSNSAAKEIETISGSPTKLELVYSKSSECTLL